MASATLTYFSNNSCWNSTAMKAKIYCPLYTTLVGWSDLLELDFLAFLTVPACLLLCGLLCAGLFTTTARAGTTNPWTDDSSAWAAGSCATKDAFDCSASVGSTRGACRRLTPRHSRAFVEMTERIRFQPVASQFSVSLSTSDATQPAILLNPATSRGPPWVFDESAFVINNKPDRPARHARNTPPPIKSRLPSSSRFPLQAVTTEGVPS